MRGRVLLVLLILATALGGGVLAQQMQGMDHGHSADDDSGVLT